MNFWQNELVRLRGVEPDDAETFHRWNEDSEMARRLDFVWPPVSLAAVRNWAEEQSRKKMDDGAFQWVIENLAGEPVGSISSHDCNPRAGTFSYGVSIAAEYQRHGYAAAAIRLVLAYYFAELRYQKATIGVVSYNEASIALHERLGFQREGTLRRMAYTRGRYYDLYWYGMTHEEWDELAQSR